MSQDSEHHGRDFGGTLRALALPLILTFLPVLLISREADLWREEKHREDAEAWHERARTVATRWERASKLSYWIETAAGRLRDSIESVLPPAAAGPVDPGLLGKTAANVCRTALPQGMAKPRVWMYALSRSADKAPLPCSGTGLETQFGRLIGSIFHEIDIRNRFDPGRPRPTTWKQSLDRLFGFGASPDLFEASSCGRSFPVIFQGAYFLCVWDFIRNDDGPAAVFLMLLPSGLGDAETARRLCFTNWRHIARGQSLEPVFISYPVGPAVPKQVRVRHGSPLLKSIEIRQFIRRKASEMCLRPPGTSDISSPGKIGRWYKPVQISRMVGELRLPDHEMQHTFPAGPGHLACWSTLDISAGGLGLLIGPSPDAVCVPALMPILPILAWIIVWLILLFRLKRKASPPAFGIRSQLAFWFLCLASIPLIIAISETGKLLVDLRGNLLREYDQKLGQALLELENEDSTMTRRFADICRNRLEAASCAVTLRALQVGGDTVDPVMNGLWSDLSGLGIPIRSMLLFGHGSFEWSRHDGSISPEFGISMVNFLRPVALKLLRTLAPAIDARIRPAKPRSSGVALDKLINADLSDMANEDRQVGEMLTGNKRLLKFHHFMKIDGETWYLLALIWEQSAAYIRHIRSRICEIATKHGVDLEITRRTSSGDGVVQQGWDTGQSDAEWRISGELIARSGKPLRSSEPGIRSAGDDRVMTIQSNLLPGFLLTASRPLAPLRQRLFDETFRVLTGVFGNLLLIFLSGGALAAWLTTPLRRMAAALREIAAGRLERKLGMERRDELGQAADTLDAMTEWLRERHAMSLFVAPQVLEAVAGPDAAARKPERRSIVALTSDIRNFTTLSETRPPDEVFSALNRHFCAMTPAIKDQGGIIDRFIGDAIQAVFFENATPEQCDGIRERSPMPTAATRALRAARAMMREHRALQQERANAGLFTYEIGIGLASGEAVCGILGAEQVRLDFSVVGEPIRISGELEAASKGGRATRIICDTFVASAAGPEGSFLPLPGRPDILEATDTFPEGAAPDHGDASCRQHLPLDEPAATLRTFIASSPDATREQTTQYYIIITILLLAAGLLFSFSSSLTSSFRERTIAREEAELQNDLRLVASANVPAVQIGIHLHRFLQADTFPKAPGSSTPVEPITGFAERLRVMQRIYPALSWCLLRHIPDMDDGPNAITPKSSEIVESGGPLFGGRASEARAVFSKIKAFLTDGHLSPDAESAVRPLLKHAFTQNPIISSALAFDSYGHLNQSEMFGKSGYMMWEPVVSQGWWDTYSSTIDATPDRRMGPNRWWKELEGGVLLFLPLDALDKTTSLRAMAKNLQARGTYLALLPPSGFMGDAIGSETFGDLLANRDAMVIRRSTTMEAYPKLLAARMIPSPPAWMPWLERLLSSLAVLLGLMAILIWHPASRSRIAAFLPTRMVPLLAGAFIMTLLPSLLSGWLAGERRMIERQARLFDDASDRLCAGMKSLDDGATWYLGQNYSSLRNISTNSDAAARLENIARIPANAQRDAAAAALLEHSNEQGLKSAMAIGNMHILGPRGLSIISSGKSSDMDTSLLRDLFYNIHSNALRRLSPAFAASEAGVDENKRTLEDLKGEEIKYLLLSFMSPYEFAGMLSAPVMFQRTVWGLNSHASVRIHLPGRTEQPEYALQVHFADNTLLHQQMRNRSEIPKNPDDPCFSMTRNNPRISMPFSVLCMHFSEAGNRITADAVSYPSHPVETSADILAAAACIPIRTLYTHGNETDLLMSQIGTQQSEYILKARLPYSRLLAVFSREANARRGILALLFVLTLFMAFRTASRFLKPVHSLGRAAGEIMQEHFDTRLQADRQDEFGELALAFNAMATGVEEGRRLRAFVSDSVRLAARDEARSKAALAGENRSAAILFAAPAGFSRLLHELEPETVISLLNRYLTVMSGLIRKNGGDIDKFIGEKILAVFDGERNGGIEPASRAAARTAAEMREAMQELGNEMHLPLGIGIVTGPVLAGIMGTSEVRLEYTVIGDTVNTAARLCDLAAKSGGGTIIDGTAASALSGRSLSPVGNILVKGKARQIAAFRLD